jgi:hypothetical protein
MLAVLFVVVAGFCASWNVPVSILERSGGLRGGFGRAPGPIIQGFSVLASLHCVKTPESQKLQFFLRFSHIACVAHLQKTAKNRFRNFSKGTAHENRTKISSGVSPGSILEGFGVLPGASWPAPGRLLVALGRLLGILGRILGASWASLGRSRVLTGTQDGLGLDFNGFRGGSGRLWAVPGPYFSTFFRPCEVATRVGFTFLYIML